MGRTMYTNLLIKESPVILSGVLIATALSIKYLPIYCTICCLAIILLLFYFYRCPLPAAGTVPNNIVLAPSYGRVISLKYHDNDTFCMAIFLDPFDVHQQYFPLPGVIKDVIDCRSGQFDFAFTGKARGNEKRKHILETKYGTVQISQIAGALVRSITSDDLPGDIVKSGQRFGMIKFGSCVMLRLPSASKFKRCVNLGDYVIGGETELGYYV